MFVRRTKRISGLQKKLRAFQTLENIRHLKKINFFIYGEYFAFPESVAANESYLLPDKPSLGPVGCDDSDMMGREMQAAVVMLHQFTHHQSLLTVAEQ